MKLYFTKEHASRVEIFHTYPAGRSVQSILQDTRGRRQKFLESIVFPFV